MLMILSRGDAPSSLAPGYHIARRWRAEPIAQCWRAEADLALLAQRRIGAVGAEVDWRCWRRGGLALLAQSGLALLARKRSNDIMPTGEK